MIETQTEKYLRTLQSTIFDDAFARAIMRVSTITEEEIALLSGRILICQTEEESLDANEYVEFAIKSDVASPVVFLVLNVTAQMSQCLLTIYEGGTATGVPPAVCLQPNRLEAATVPNSTMLQGTPSAPITGTLGTSLNGAGWKLVGVDGVSSADLTKETIEIGGFICIPETWYRIRVQNTSGVNGRTLQMSLRYVDPSTPEA